MVPTFALLDFYTTESETDTALLEKNEKKTQPEPLWKVILYNSDHYFHEVEFQLQLATGCSLAVAQQIAVRAHIHGKAVAFVGEKSRCERVAAILRQIELIVSLEKDA